MNDSTKIRPLVLGTAMGYEWKQLAPFVLSCKQYIPDVMIVLFSSDLSLETISKLESQNVKVIFDSFNKQHHFVGWKLAFYQLRMYVAVKIISVLTKNTLESGCTSFVEIYSSVVIQRFYRYLRYLKTYGSLYSHVLLVDVRDVLFQSNPFPCCGLHVFAENETIGQSHFARRWFQLSYGITSWKKFANFPLLNVGTTLGDCESVTNYVRQMCSEFDQLLSFFWGVDTSAHNTIVYKKLSKTVINNFGEGAVLTLNSINRDSIRVENGLLVNSIGTPYSILHQYDRVKGLDLELQSLLELEQ